MMTEFERDPYLTENMMLLLKEINEKFSPEENAADLGILYEVTGFKAET